MNINDLKVILLDCEDLLVSIVPDVQKLLDAVAHMQVPPDTAESLLRVQAALSELKNKLEPSTPPGSA